MINYRVDTLGELLVQLREGGVDVAAGPASHENGRFAWIMDADENKVQLWEPMIWNDKNKEGQGTSSVIPSSLPHSPPTGP